MLDLNATTERPTEGQSQGRNYFRNVSFSIFWKIVTCQVMCPPFLY